MKPRLMLYYLLLMAGLCQGGEVMAQPERLHYFADSARSYAILDPGQEMLERNLLISNQATSYNVSFALSFDKATWNGFALSPRYSSIYSLQGEKGCFIRIRTSLGGKNSSVSEVVYFLVRGKCYSVYWNKQLRRWDIVENACRR